MALTTQGEVRRSVKSETKEKKGGKTSPKNQYWRVVLTLAWSSQKDAGMVQMRRLTAHRVFSRLPQGNTVEIHYRNTTQWHQGRSSRIQESVKKASRRVKKTRLEEASATKERVLLGSFLIFRRLSFLSLCQILLSTLIVAGTCIGWAMLSFVLFLWLFSF